MPPTTRRQDRARLISAVVPRDGGDMAGLLRRSEEPGAELARHPSRRTHGCIATGGTGAIAAGALVLGTFVFTPASSAQTTGAGTAASGPGAAVEWAGFAGNAQHTAVAMKPPQPFDKIRWRAKVDLAPQLVDGELLIHYGSPMITAANTVLVPTRVSAKGGFRVVAYSGTSGKRRWSLNTDYRMLANGLGAFTPPLPAVLTPSKTLAVAGA